jgi:hypothetical protein
MLISQIRRAQDAKPFRSFTIAIRGGQRVKVGRPDNVFIPRIESSDFVVALPKGTYRLIDAWDVTKLEFASTGRSVAWGAAPTGEAEECHNTTDERTLKHVDQPHPGGR